VNQFVPASSSTMVVEMKDRIVLCIITNRAKGAAQLCNGFVLVICHALQLVTEVLVTEVEFWKSVVFYFYEI